MKLKRIDIDGMSNPCQLSQLDISIFCVEHVEHPYFSDPFAVLFVPAELLLFRRSRGAWADFFFLLQVVNIKQWPLLKELRHAIHPKSNRGPSPLPI